MFEQALEIVQEEMASRHGVFGYKDFVGFIVEAADRMQKLIADFLAYSRAGRKGLKMNRVDCNELLRNVTNGLSQLIEDTRETVSYKDLTTVAGADVGFTQVLQNLIGNALKFHGPQAPEIHIAAKRGHNEWIFSVSDNGIGMEPKYAEKIFKVFQRLHSRSEYDGTGIGLSICKKIVENWGGGIRVESEPGCGSTFYFTVPKLDVREREDIERQYQRESDRDTPGRRQSRQRAPDAGSVERREAVHEFARGQ